jgi:glyoxylase-like metal-dependent hydrolase (beta-lactamase superfamily II)
VFQNDLFSADHLIGVHQQWVEAGGVRFQVIQTPGHSVSHVSFVTPDNVCYAGDVFSSPELLSKARLLYTFCYAEDLKSKQLLRELDCGCFIVAHRGVFPDAKELARANIDYIHQRVELVLSYLDRPMTREEIYRALFVELGLHGGSPWKESNVLNMLGALIEYLQTTQRVTTECRDGVFLYTKKG